MVLPQSLTNHVLKLAHDEMSHNGSAITYITKEIYNWEGPRPVFHKYI